MEKNNGTRLLAVFALVIAVAGLSLGFAAFSTTLKISTAAKVSANTTNWKVGFSTNGTSIVTETTDKAAEASNPGVLSVTKYTLSQKENNLATLSTTAGSSVSYKLWIMNEGSVPAYLDEVSFEGLTMVCTNDESSTGSGDYADGAGTQVIGGNSTSISNADCAKMFDVTFNIGGDGVNAGVDYTSTTTSIGTTLAAGTAVPVTLTVAYNATTGADVAATLDGDIIVNIGSISVVYVSTAPAASVLTPSGD